MATVKTKFIFVTGGVVSSLGEGLALEAACEEELKALPHEKQVELLRRYVERLPRQDG